MCSTLSVCVLVTQLCPTLCNPKDCSLPGSSVHGILQARILEQVASHSPFQGIFPTQGLLHCRWSLYRLSHQESPIHFESAILNKIAPLKLSKFQKENHYHFIFKNSYCGNFSYGFIIKY